MQKTTCDFYPNNPNNPRKKTGQLGRKRPDLADNSLIAEISDFQNGDFGFPNPGALRIRDYHPRAGFPEMPSSFHNRIEI